MISWRVLAQPARAVGASLMFVMLGLLFVWLAKRYLKLDGDAVLVALLVLPAVIYMIFSGRLSELKAGGLEAKFAGVAAAPVEPASESVAGSVAEMQMVAKLGTGELKRRLQRLDESKPITLTLTTGKDLYYDRSALRTYVEELSRFRNFKFVIVLDHENRLVAYLPSWALSQILKLEALGDEFVRMLNEDRIGELRQYPGIITHAISTSSNNVEALREMTRQNIEAVVVVDGDRRVRGVVEREQILSKLLLAMAR